MKNILIYFPYNQRTVEQQSVMEMLVSKGHKVFLLTLLPEYHLHNIVRTMGVNASASPVTHTNRLINIYQNARYLIRFCKQHSIDIIIAHQQETALPLIFASSFIKCKTYYFRHNTDEHYNNFPVKSCIVNHFINAMLPNIVAPSNAVYTYMTKVEKVPVKKMDRINYGYNFNQYEKPDAQRAADIRKKYDCDFLIISIARLVPAKRHKLMFEVVEQLIRKGLNVKLVCLGGGNLKDELEKYLTEKGLTENIFLLGIQFNIFDYFAAGELLLHLSESEASNSVVKEAGLAETPVIVCNNVGDFDDYISHGKNGFLVNKKDPVPETISIIGEYYFEKDKLQTIGKNLHQTVVQEFDINNVVIKYENLLK